MKVRAPSSRRWLLLLLLVAALAGGHDLQAQPAAGPPAKAHHAFDPTTLQPGAPLPGTGYPWQPVQRAAPSGWAPGAPPPGIDLDVTFINRAPIYRAYCVQYAGGIPSLCPGTEGEQRWPAPGEVVTFTAHVVNKGADPSPAFAYKWYLDGAAVLTATHPALAAAAEATVIYTWPWGHTMDGERVVDDHTIGLAVDPDDLIAEAYETNNWLEDRTNALGFRLAITPQMYEAYNTPWDPAFSYSAEDWLQRQIAAMNWSFANSTYPTTPGGATERVRINEIVITTIPPAYDRLSDGGWFVDADYRLVSGGYDPNADVDWNLVHELSHQVGLIDLYMSGIYATVVHVLDREGGPANVGFAWAHPGLMGGGDISPHTDPHLYASHSAAGFSATKGYRRGYYGEYQFDIPAQNYLQVLDNQGDPAPDVQVALYQRTGPLVWPGDSTIDNTPEISGTTGPDGRLLLPNRSVGGGVTTHTGHTLADNPFGLVDVVGKQNVFLIKLDKGDHQEFAWTDVTAFNLAFWAGDTISHTFVLSSHVPLPTAPAPPAGAVARCEMSMSTLCWDPSPSPDVVGYHVYRATPPAYAYQQVGGLQGGPCFSELLGATRIYAVTAVDSLGRESGFSNFAWAPRLMRPYAVALMSDGLRTVLDPQNGYALLRQRPDGRYLQNVGSVHYHLENSLYLDVDPDDRLILSHPADWYVDRHSVRVADRDAVPQFEFGERGSGPGQFETPAGVVAVGPPFRFLVADAGNHRLQAFDGAGNFVTAYGSFGSGPGQFATPTGLAVDRDGLVIVADSENDRIQVLRFDGLSFDYLRTITAGLDYPTGLDVDGGNRIVVADTYNNRVVVLNAAGHLLAEFTEPNDGYSGPFNQPRDVLVDGAGNIVVADTFNGRVVTILDALPPGPPSTIYLPLVLRNYLHTPTFECQEQLQNGGFEDDGAWVVSSTPRPARYVTELAHGGERSVLLGLKPGESDVYSYSSVWQAVTLPADVYSATLTFWHDPLSDLDDGDRQECLLLDEEGGLLEIVHRDNLNTAAWTQVTYDLAAYAGQTVRIYCNAYNDGDDLGVTGFYLDDVSLVTCTPRP